jgi:hypothetical protein
MAVGATKIQIIRRIVRHFDSIEDGFNFCFPNASLMSLLAVSVAVSEPIDFIGSNRVLFFPRAVTSRERSTTTARIVSGYF